MIEAKGTKTTAPETDASQRYNLKSMDKKSKTPMAFGVLLTGLILYFKSIFPSLGSHEDSIASEPEKEGLAGSAMTDAQMLLPPDAEIAGTEPSPEAAIGSGSPLVDLQSPAQFIQVATPEIGAFLPPESPIAWKALPAPLHVAHANDNIQGRNLPSAIETDGPDLNEPDPGGDSADIHADGTDTPDMADADECPRTCSNKADNEHQPTCNDAGGDRGDVSSSKDADSPCDEGGNVASRPSGNCGPTLLPEAGSCAVLAIGLSHSLPRHQPGGAGECMLLADQDLHEGFCLDADDDCAKPAEEVTIDIVAGCAQGWEVGKGSISGFEHAAGGQDDNSFIISSEPALFAGGGGKNLFDFGVMQSEQDLEAEYEIIDFKVGDRIRVSGYDRFEETRDAPEDRFEKIYGHDIDSGDVPIRYCDDLTEEMARTIIDTDFNNDGACEIANWLEGHHVAMTMEHA